MSQSAGFGTVSWWDRWFKKRPASRPPSRQTRQARRTSTPTASARQPSPRPEQAPAAASCPSIAVQQASEESGDQAWFEDHTAAQDHSVPGPSGTGAPSSPPPGPSGTGAPSSPPPGPSSVESSESARAAPEEGNGAGSSGETTPVDMTASTLSGGFEKANRVVLRTDSATVSPATGADGEDGEVSQTPTHTAPDDTDVEKLKTRIEECRTALQAVTDFSYETKEKKKISELTAEGQKLLSLWRDALDKKDVLSQIIRECTDAANQSSDRLTREVWDLEQLYGELAAALANLRRTADRRKAVKKDIKAMTKVVSNVLAKEQAEVGKVAAQHEKEVYSKWQSLKGMPPNVPALENLKKELTEKQRAISGLDGLVQRRLQQAQQTSHGEPGSASPPTDTASNKRTGKASPQRIPVSPSRRGGAGRAAGKRKLTDEARHERKATINQRNQMVMRYQGGPTAGAGGGAGVAATGVATQAGYMPGQAAFPAGPVSVIAGQTGTAAGLTGVTATTSTAAPPAPPPPPPPPLPPGGPLAHLLRVTAEDEDSGAADSGADETSTSNDEDGAALEVDEAVLAAAFPLHFGAAILDGMDAADAARAMADAMHFH